MERASKHQARAELSRATLGLSFSSPRALKIKLFKPDNSKKSSFSSLAKKDFFLVYFIPKILYTSIFTA
jgi:hypothetical protein